MRVLVIGSGGREHALAWKIRQSPSVMELFCAPGNPGISVDAQVVPIQADDSAGLLGFAVDQRIDLTVVGPEQPLANGIVDLFLDHDLRIFGPTQRAAQLEWSKAFAKDFMTRHSIPTAAYRVFPGDDVPAIERHLKKSTYPVVLKADGLAAGKGVIICRDFHESMSAVRDVVETRLFGSAGEALVIEEFMSGTEASVFAITDGHGYVTLAPAQDYKRIFDNDAGKNTGGMGAYAPTPVVTTSVLQDVRRLIIEPTLKGMRDEGIAYRGCLYVGLMITPEGPRVVEYNSRFGDPETQVVLPLFKGDFAQLLLSSATSGISDWSAEPALGSSSDSAVCVILASGGYPDHYQKGKEIRGLAEFASQEDLVVFHAGTSLADGKIVTAGGRVLGVVAYGREGIGTLRTRAYEGVARVTFDGMQFRTDIGMVGQLSGTSIRR